MENQQVNGIAFEKMKFTWKIEAFSKVKTRKMSSKAFKIDGHRWKIVLYPMGRDVEYLSLYLKVADSLPPYGWSRFVYFRLALINQVDNMKTIVKETQKKFNAGNSAWGSPSLILLNEFRDPTKGYLVNDTCIIEAQVSVSKVAFNIPNNLAQGIPTTNETNSDQPRLTEELSEQEMTPSESDVLLSPTSTLSSKDDQVSEAEIQFSWSQDQGKDQSDETLNPKPKQVHFVPSAPPMYPPLFNEYEEVISTPLSNFIDFNSLQPEELSFIPLWEEVCSWHPSLLESQRRRSPRFILWAFIALGRVLHFLKTKTIRDMDEDEFTHLQVLWEELQPFGFDLTWLEPHVQSALGAKGHLERAEYVKSLRDNVATLEIEMRKFKAKLAVAEIDLEVARRDLAAKENGFEERDMDAELGYGIP